MDQLLEEDEGPSTSKIINLTKSLNLQDLISANGATFEVNFDDLPDEKEEFSYSTAEATEFSNPNCSGLIDEDTYTDGEPFEVLSAKMENLLEDGSIKKRILRNGYGDVIPDKATVTIHFNAYIEYNDEPFDSTYLRKKPFVFILNVGATIPGIDIATQSMKIVEKSQFLVVPRYAYGPLGCLQRVPPNSTVLFEIEVLSYVDAGAATSKLQLDQDGEQEYTKIDKYVHALCAKGNELFSKGSMKPAIKVYNQAVAALENCKLKDYDEQEKQQRLLLRLLTNLVVSYTKVQDPKRACSNCNKIYYICKGTSLKVPTKVYFNHGKCLIMFGDYEWAERKLKQAQRLEPQNIEISRELLKLDQKKKESYNREIALAKAIFKNNEINTNVEVSDEFKASMTEYCKDLIADTESVQYSLPDNLTPHEISFCRSEVAKHGLRLTCQKQNKVNVYAVVKQI
ncbi:hypothetical protein RN001_014442 [Aquatica leii]|uniref:peptidylprolyl isomerase n=1 Tax=Aquatica leii TaxID=1421715 RepID=A0AAN7SKJ4_9COLE|nr:hypothetical protein RN001_014442 [Aquatica leii]